VVTLNLTITQPSLSTETATACGSYIWHGTTYTSSNITATWTGTNAAGCDSVVTLNLTINQPSTLTETVSACGSYIWHGTTYTSSNITATWTGTNAAGCDSLVTLNLTINQSSTSIETVSACGSFVWHGTTYTSSNNTATWTGTNVAGCDSVVTLHLTINTSTSSIETILSAGAFVWHGVTYSTSTNTPTWQTTNAAGCDSIVTLHLTITCSPNTGDTTVSACGSFVWYGVTYTSSTNLPTHTFTNVSGCDSVVTLHLTIQSVVPTKPATITQTLVSNVCGARVYRYSASAIANGLQYLWLVPTSLGGDTSAIIIDSGNINSKTILVRYVSNNGASTTDSIKVASFNGCTSIYTAAKLTITAMKVPAAPLTFTGIAVKGSSCGARTYRITAPSLPTATSTLPAATGYVWSFVGNLSNYITIDSGTVNSQVIIIRCTSNEAAAVGDNIRLLYTSSCGNSQWKSIKMTITKLSPPALPTFTATLVSNECGARIYRYTASALTPGGVYVGAATGYVWSFTGSLGSNAVIDSGDVSSQKIRVRFTSNNAASVGDNVRVAFTSDCGNSLWKSYKLTNTALLTPTPASITQTLVTNTCGARVYRYTAPALTNATTTAAATTGYSWTLPIGNVGSTGTLDSGSLSGRTIRIIYTSNAAAATSDSIKVAYVSACGTGNSKAIKLTNLVKTGCPAITKLPYSKTNNNQNNQSSMQVTVFPNPSKSNFNLQVTTANKEVVTARVLDLQGRFIKSIMVTPYQTQTLGSDLKAGVYLIEVRQGQQVKTMRVVKF
jgi:hypothetical protein